MLHLLATLHLHPEHLPAFLQALPPFLAHTRADPACLHLHAFSPTQSPHTVHLLETWTDPAAHQRHTQHPHTQSLLAQLPTWLSQPMQLQQLTPLGD